MTANVLDFVLSEVAQEHFVDPEYGKKAEIELIELRKRLEFLSALEAAGVDNWEGYSIAWNMIDDGEGW